jgi:hypothetical protein
MTIEKITVVDSIEALENGCIQVRAANRIVENGTVLSQSFHRHVVAPGDDYSKEDIRVQGVCAALHTVQVIEAYKASQVKESLA